MTQFSFKCICCNTEIDITADQAGFVVYCPECMAELIVPEFSGDTPPISTVVEPHDESDLYKTDSVVLKDSFRRETIVPDPDYDAHTEEADLHKTDSVMLKDNLGGQYEDADDMDYSMEPENPSPSPPTPASSGDPEGRPQGTISQIIHRAASGEPLIPEDVARAVASGEMNEMTETKMALAETLKALQEHQRALAEARKELADNKVIQSDTNMMEISETTNKLLVQESQNATNKLEASSFVLQVKDAQVEEEEPQPAEEASEHHEEHTHPDEMEYRPFYTPHGEFLPFSDEDISDALQHESDDIINAVSQIQPGPQCWSYSVFALLLESHITTNLPEQLPITPMSGVFFGSSQKYVDELRAQQTIFMNVMRRMIKPMGVQFQFALKQHDVYSFMEIIYELDVHFRELHQFMMNFQQIAFPKKDPFIRYREMMLESYDHVRHRLVRVVERLDHRSTMTPEQAALGTISVSLNTPHLHEMAVLLNLFPVQ